MAQPSNNDEELRIGGAPSEVWHRRGYPGWPMAGSVREMPLEPASHFVFRDPRGRRWPRFRGAAFWSAVLLGMASVLFLTAVWIRPVLRLPAMVRELKGHLKVEALKAATQDAKAENWQRYYEKSRAGQERMVKLRAQLGAQVGSEVRVGFYVDWDANAMASRLRGAVADAPGLAFTQDTQANAVFVTLPAGVADRLRESFRFYDWDAARGEVRWMCAFDTTSNDVDRFATAVWHELTAAALVVA